MSKRLYCLELERMNYHRAWQLQLQCLNCKIRGGLKEDVLLLLEHNPVFTLGRHSTSSNLKVSQDFLRTKGIDVVHIERGGDITYHGPGQLVAYPLLDLRQLGLKIKRLVYLLEEVMLLTAAHFQVQASRNPLNHGIWVESRKLGSLGIAIRRKICFHGLAFNVDLPLDPFTWINPCGLADVAITSLSRETGHRVSMQEARKQLRASFQSQLSMEVVPLTLAELKNHLGDEHELDCKTANVRRQTQMVEEETAQYPGLQ